MVSRTVRTARYGAAALCLAGLCASVASSPRLAAATAPPRLVDARSAADDLRASAIARTYGHPVEVESHTSEVEQVFAQPDGSDQLVVSAEPSRVRVGGQWRPVDLTLRAGADGLIEPLASPVPVRFSPGGSGPLAQVRSQLGDWAQLSWARGALPAPVLSEASATYRDVYPGVDLVLSATVSGAAEVLVVHSASAAANPALRGVAFGVSTPGLSESVGSGGGLDATSPHGAALHVGTATWWDSSSSGASVSGPGGGSVPQAVPATIAPGRVSVDVAAAVSATVHYPLYVDPPWTGGRQAWTFVDTAYPDTSNWNGGTTDGKAHVGFIDNAHSYQGNILARSLFQMDTHVLAGKQILAAEFNVTEVWSSSCSKQPVELWSTAPISSHTTWRHQPGWATKQDSRTVAYGYYGCPSHAVGFRALQAVQYAAAHRSSSVTLGLRAAHEKSWLSWKKFNVHTAQLVTTYNTVPAAPIARQTVPATACVTSGALPAIATLTPTLEVLASDADRDVVKAEFDWYVTGGALRGSVVSAAKSSGSWMAATVPTGAFADGQTMTWHSRVWDGHAWSPYSGNCVVHFDRTAPSSPPGITSSTFAACTDIACPVPTLPAGSAGSFSLDNGGIADVTGYVYSLNGHAATTIHGSGASLALRPGLALNRLTAYSVDAAGNHSASRDFWFKLAPTGHVLARWDVAYADPSPAVPLVLHSSSSPDVTLTGAENPATVAGDTDAGPSFADDAGRSVVVTDGKNDLALSAGPVVTTTDGVRDSFTVLARIKPDVLDNGWVQTAVSQAGGSADSLFFLQYAPGGAIRFALTSAPGLPRSIAAVTSMSGRCGFQSTDPEAANYWSATGWHTVAGVYDKDDAQIQLWVDGCLAQQVAAPTTVWNVQGRFALANALGGPAYNNAFGGEISWVHVFRGVLTDDQMGDRNA